VNVCFWHIADVAWLTPPRLLLKEERTFARREPFSSWTRSRHAAASRKSHVGGLRIE
jgi:hypothetical protein